MSIFIDTHEEKQSTFLRANAFIGVRHRRRRWRMLSFSLFICLGRFRRPEDALGGIPYQVIEIYTLNKDCAYISASKFTHTIKM